MRTGTSSSSLPDVSYLDGREGTGLDAVPAAHAHVLKNHGRLKTAIDLFDHFAAAGGGGCAHSSFGIALPRVAPVILHSCKSFLGLQNVFTTFRNIFKNAHRAGLKRGWMRAMGPLCPLAGGPTTVTVFLRFSIPEAQDSLHLKAVDRRFFAWVGWAWTVLPTSASVRRLRYTAADLSRDLVGMQPRLRQVPPKLSWSS